MILLITIFSFLYTDTVQIKDIKIGLGESSVIGDKLIVDYVGTLITGEEFDSSYKRSEPISFTLGEGRVIVGWEQGLVGVKKGGRRYLKVPASLAYGNRKNGGIPANSILIFTIDIVDIVFAERPLIIPENVKKVNLNPSEYYIIKPGSGLVAKDKNKVRYNYKLFNQTNLKLFSTYDSKEPEEIILGQKIHMIPGFEDALYGVQVGEIRKIICQSPSTVENETFIFDIEIISIE